MSEKIKHVNKIVLKQMILEFDKTHSKLSASEACKEFLKINPNLGYRPYGTDSIIEYQPESVARIYRSVRANGLTKPNFKPKTMALPFDELPEEEVKKVIREDINKIASNSKLKELERKYKFVLKELEESEKRVETFISLKEIHSDNIHKILPGTSGEMGDAIPIIMLSDWHFEERVDDYTINGYNHYNLDIASKRWFSCIQNSLKLVQKERQSSNINNLLLWLGGDFITGYIHEELEENNYLSPTEAIRYAKEKIISAINFYLDYGAFDKITIVCNYGNHGRTTKKSRISTGFRNSYEWMMYKDIEDYFKSNKQIEFVIPSGLFAYIKLYDYNIRFWHGDTIKYGGGIGGLTVPLIKAIHRMNQQIKADYNFMGHYHQFWEATKDCMVNGSGIGFNAYAQAIGANPEKPMQGFRLLDKKHGMTTKLPIFCE